MNLVDKRLDKATTHVSYGSNAAETIMAPTAQFVRYCADSDHTFAAAVNDVKGQERPKCVAPKPMLFDHLIGANKQRCGGPLGRATLRSLS